MRDTYLRDDNGQPELITSRNDPYINPHDRLQLQGWRANVDLKPVLSMNAALQYISKYASKSEPRSEAFSDILNRILNDSNSDASSLSAFQALLLHTVAERDISTQETCHILLGLPLYHSSRQFVSLNLNKQTPRWLCSSGYDDESFPANGEVGRTVQSPLQKYWDRPVELEDVTLYELHLIYKFCKGQWNRCKQENIVRIWPHPSPLINGPQWEEYCRVKVLLHVCHRSLHQLTEDNTLSWSDLFNQHRETIEAEADLLGPPVNNLNNESVDEESDLDQEELDDEDQIRPDWMVLSEMRPGADVDISSDLGTCDIDQNYDWFSDVRRSYPNLNLSDISNFIQQARNIGLDDDERLDTTYTVDCQKLNDKQLTIFCRIESHYVDLLTEPGQIEPLRLIVMGTAGTGKSYLIKMIRDRLWEIARDHNVDTQSPVVVLAPTGVAAFNIHGVTIHSALLILINKNYDLTGERLKKLQKNLSGVSYFIIDEKSMVGRRMLALLDM